MKKIRLYIEVDSEDDSTCGDNCAFLEYSECLLFSKDLEDTILPENLCWQDGVSPTKQRCHNCLIIT